MQNAEGTWVSEAHELGQSAISFKVERLLHAEKSAYQTIEIYESSAWGNIMVLDGCLMVTTRDDFLYHEMMSHPALFTHPRAKRVCIIGGGDRAIFSAGQEYNNCLRLCCGLPWRDEIEWALSLVGKTATKLAS